MASGSQTQVERWSETVAFHSEVAGRRGFPCQHLQVEAPPLEEAKDVEDQPEAGDVCSEYDKCKLGSVRAMMLLRLKRAETMNANQGIPL